MAKKEEKVFCGDCEYLEISGPQSFRCVQPDNLKETQHDFLRRYFITINPPQKLNANNDCKNHKEK
ncbi:MAG: hypothetical protein WC551_10645 [Patescibacteria group bacterium]|jgi:hypothetical protein